MEEKYGLEIKMYLILIFFLMAPHPFAPPTPIYLHSNPLKKRETDWPKYKFLYLVYMPGNSAFNMHCGSSLK